MYSPFSGTPWSSYSTTVTSTVRLDALSLSPETIIIFLKYYCYFIGFEVLMIEQILRLFVTKVQIICQEKF